MDLDSGPIHPSFYMKEGGGVAPQLLMGDNHSASSFEDRLAQGSADIGDLLHTAEGKMRALEIFGRTDTGRRRAEEIFGPDVWNNPGVPNVHDPLGIGMGTEGEGDDSMFVDLVNEDDDEENERRRAAEHSHIEGLEVDRHDMESLLEA